ncbi:MAG TPA: helix-turn-helix transcriptional regulator [Bacilli bacterium]|nr:helix-turn-helix transcriptional regulator [Bacilli bacterium]
MTTGRKIEKLRKQLELTTDDLAKKLDVSRQTIYKWETDSALPDIPHLKQLAAIFNTTTDYLLSEEENEPTAVLEEKKPEAESTPMVIINNPQPEIEYVCMTCGKVIRKGEKSFPHAKTERIRHGKTSRDEVVGTGVECEACHNKRMEDERLQRLAARNAVLSEAKKRRIWNFVVLGLLLALTLSISIPQYVSGDSIIGTIVLVFGLLVTISVPTVILGNTFVSDVFIGMASWGFVKFPGIIFSFSVDGFVFLIAMKVLFFILGIAVMLGAFLLACVITGLLSIFVYPYALVKNINNPETTI